MIQRPVQLLQLLFILPISSVLVSAQQPAAHKSINLVVPNGNGRIVIPAGDDIQWQTANLFDHGTRPVFQIENKSSKLAISYILFPNQTKSNFPKICRDDVLNAAMRGLAPPPIQTDIKEIKKYDHPPIDGQPIASGSFFVKSVMDLPLQQQNLFAVAASPTLCAEIHISKTPYQPIDERLLTAQVDAFSFEPDYAPTTQDYYTLATIFYRITKSYEAAAVYYQRTLDTLPPNTALNARRVIIDQLAMSYGISGQIKQSRAVNEAAIKSDPDYPLNYYNLACADAEQGKAADAKLHLQQAFDRKANTIPGETLPDPTKDDSILKLKKDKEFWAFVQTLK